MLRFVLPERLTDASDVSVLFLFLLLYFCSTCLNGMAVHLTQLVSTSQQHKNISQMLADATACVRAPEPDRRAAERQLATRRDEGQRVHLPARACYRVLRP